MRARFHLNRQETRTLPDSSAESMHYNDTPIATVQQSATPASSVGAGQLEYAVDFEGRVTAYRYNNTTSGGGGGRLVGTYYYASEADYLNDAASLTAALRSITYTYDAFGRVIETNDSGHGQTFRGYDAEGRLTQTDSPEGTLNYEYDALGRQIRTYTDNTDTRYTYDVLGRLESVQVVERAGATITEDPTIYYYDAAGNLTAMTQSDGISVDYIYDSLNRLVEMYHFTDTNGDHAYSAGEALKASFIYGYDNAGNRITSAEWVDANNDGVQDTGETFNWQWTYDGLNRLVQETLDAGDDALDTTTTYQFDLAGNRTQQQTDAGNDGSIDVTTTYAYDANDRLTQEVKDSIDDTQDRNTVYAYQGTTQTGKTVREGTTVGSGVVREQTAMTYNAMGRLASSTVTTYDATGTQTQQVVTEYAYNNAGLRVTETTTTDGGASVVKSFLFDPKNPTGYAQVLEEYIAGALSKTFILGQDVLAQHDATNGNLTLLYDAHGSTRAVLNTLGAIVQSYAYTAYGTMLTSATLTGASATLTNILYSGEWTQANGQQYLRARFYDPSSGRFNRLDPYAGNTNDPLGLHKYTYAHGNPIMGIDPSGMTSLIGQLGKLSILTILFAVVAPPVAGVYNLARGGSFLPDAAILGASTTITGGQANPYIGTELSSVLGVLLGTLGAGVFGALESNGIFGFDPSIAVGGSAFIYGIVASLLGGVPSLGHGITVGVEAVYNARSLERSLFFYVGPGISGPTPNLSGSISGYSGFVWNLERNADYEGPFVSASLNFPLFGISNTSISGFSDLTNSIFGVHVGLGVSNGGGVGANLSLTSYSTPQLTSVGYSSVYYGLLTSIPPYNLFLLNKAGNVSA